MCDIRTVSGVLCVNKPSGCTSHDVIYKIRRMFGTKQVGHTGTLDPLAEGVLVIMIGRAVKASEFLVSEEKEYLAGLRLGITTDTEDITGKIRGRYEGIFPSPASVREAAESFRGDILQVPPMYSALKVDGKKLLELARAGREIERAPRPVRVDALEVMPTEDRAEYRLLVRVSKGTYIRTLCSDIGKALGTGGVMSSLVRLSCGDFGLEDSVTLDRLSDMDENQRLSCLRPVDSLFSGCPGVKLADFYARLGLCGCELYQHKLGTHIPENTLVRLCDKDGFFALGRVRIYPDGSAIKPVKQFRI